MFEELSDSKSNKIYLFMDKNICINFTHSYSLPRNNPDIE